MYGWHLIKAKREGILILEPGRFISEEYLRGNVAYGLLTVGGVLTVFLTACLFRLSDLYCRLKNQNIEFLKCLIYI